LLPLVAPLALPLIEAMGVEWGLIALAVIIAFGAFFGGGLIVAFFSPGHTIREPAIASTLAIAVNQAY